MKNSRSTINIRYSHVNYFDYLKSQETRNLWFKSKINKIQVITQS